MIKDLLNTARREIGIIVSTPVYLLCMVVLPLFVMIFFTTLMQQGQPNKMPVGIVDLDNTTTTRSMTRKLDAFQNTNVVAFYNSVDEARQAIQENKIYGFMYFPKGTTDKLLASRQPKISFYYTYTSLTAGALLYKDLKTIATLGSAGVGSKTMSAKGFTDKQIKTFLQPIAIDMHAVRNPWTNYNFYLTTMLVPGCMMLFIFLITPYSFGTELKFNRAKKLLAISGENTWAMLLGKLLPQTLIFLVMFYIYSFYTYGLLGFPHEGGVAYPAARAARRNGVAGVRGVHVRTDALAPHVDEHLLPVGGVELLACGHGIPRIRHGCAARRNSPAVSAETLLPHIPDERVQ